MTESSRVFDRDFSQPPFCYIQHLNAESQSDLNDHQRKILAYFEERTQGQRLASRADLAPADIVDTLPNLALYDMIYDDGAFVDFKVRLIGTNMSLKYGEQTGKHYQELLDTPQLFTSATRVMESVKDLAKNKAPLVCYSSFKDREKYWYHVIILYIPLSSNGETVDMALSYTDIRETSNTF